ncbi:thaumatin-like protein 1 [Abrus precatorius]|uniref:Thaumatin-like protein 1 n=1 Tax=Abrus precatorius TaxID=3816 RepID=A0A8B8K8W3_ABRPR|nr:thaumatin-like protein 1 [Abrus precatorius]
MVKPKRTWLLSLLLLALQLTEPGVNSAKFTLINQCNYTVWPASLSTGGNENLSTTGFVLKTGESSTVTAPAKWNGRFWGRTLCATGHFSCVTGDCGSGKVECGGSGSTPPATLVEISLNGANGQDFFDVSLIDGYNVPVMVIPVGVSGRSCNSTGCPADLNAVCPTELKVTEKGNVVGCQGACGAFGLQFFCCVGNHSTPSTCEPSAYSKIFKTACPQAYSFAYDDSTSTFTCSSADYNIIFCPSSNNASLRVGDTLIAGNGTTRWLSQSGDFAFGFYQLPNELYLLAIWYENIPNRTIIWSANGDSHAPKGSRLELNDSRGLVLSNPQGSELWRSGFTSRTIYSGLMNDNGNFQLLDQNLMPVWESFSHPTDTLVPTQVMQLNGNLYSRQGEFNFSPGRFKLHLHEDGNVVLNLVICLATIVMSLTIT